MLLRSSTAKTGKNARLGITSQKMLIDRSATESFEALSTFIHMNARSDVSGSETRIAATNDERLPTSLTATTTMAVRSTLRMMRMSIVHFLINLVKNKRSNLLLTRIMYIPFGKVSIE